MTQNFKIQDLISKNWSLGLLVFIAIYFTGCKEDGDLIFHDSFEYYEVGIPPLGPWTTSGKGTVAVDSTRSHTGDFSIYFESGERFENRAFLNLEGNPLFPFKYNRITGSYYLWLDEASPDGIHWTMVQASGSVREQGFSSEVRYGGQHQKRLMGNYDTKGLKTDCWHHSATVIPEKQWVKIGWQFDGNNHTMRFWLDDKPVEDLTISEKGQGCVNNDLKGKWIFPTFEQLMIGWVDYQSDGGTRRFWIDDVRLYQ